MLNTAATLILADGTELTGRVGLLRYEKGWGGLMGLNKVDDPAVLGGLAGSPLQLRIGEQAYEVSARRAHKHQVELLSGDRVPDGVS